MSLSKPRQSKGRVEEKTGEILRPTPISPRPVLEDPMEIYPSELDEDCEAFIDLVRFLKGEKLRKN